MDAPDYCVLIFFTFVRVCPFLRSDDQHQKCVVVMNVVWYCGILDDLIEEYKGSVYFNWVFCSFVCFEWIRVKRNKGMRVGCRAGHTITRFYSVQFYQRNWMKFTMDSSSLHWNILHDLMFLWLFLSLALVSLVCAGWQPTPTIHTQKSNNKI